MQLEAEARHHQPGRRRLVSCIPSHPWARQRCFIKKGKEKRRKAAQEQHPWTGYVPNVQRTYPQFPGLERARFRNATDRADTSWADKLRLVPLAHAHDDALFTSSLPCLKCNMSKRPCSDPRASSWCGEHRRGGKDTMVLRNNCDSAPAVGVVTSGKAGLWAGLIGLQTCKRFHRTHKLTSRLHKVFHVVFRAFFVPLINRTSKDKQQTPQK